MKTNTWVLALLIGGLAVLSACSRDHGLIGGQNGAVLKSITLTPANPTVTLAFSPPATQQFSAIGNYSFGNPQDITNQVSWISSDTTVVTIDKSGLATAINSGRAQIAAQYVDPLTGKVVQSQTIMTVVPQLTSITVNPSAAHIAHGTSQQFIAMGGFNDKSTADITSQVTWMSSELAVATVSVSPGTQGQATGVAAGSATITASFNGLAASSSLTVSNANLVSLAVSPANPTVPFGTNQQLTATGSFDDGTSQDVSATANWSSSLPTVARVAATGAVFGVGLGNSTVTASVGGISDSAAVTVDSSSVTGVSIVAPNKIGNGTRAQLRAVATLADGGSLEITQTLGVSWSSSNTSVATVDAANGLVTAVGPGSASVSANLGGKSGSVTLEVANAAIQSLAVAPGNAVVAQGALQRMVALAVFSDGSGSFQQDISSAAAWSSDNPAVASVSYVDGLEELALGISSGTANISASFAAPGGGSATSSVPLNVSSAQLSSISLTPGSALVPLGGGYQFTATGTFSDGSQVDLTLLGSWTTLNPEVASMRPTGYADASGPGQTSVSETFESQTGSGSILVNPAALGKIDICAIVANPLANCPPLDPYPPPPPIFFAQQAPFALVAVGTFSDGSRADLTTAVHWSSSQRSVAVISNDPGIPGFATGVSRQGVVTGIQAGTTTLTAGLGGVSGSSTVSVTAATLQFLTITPADGSIAGGTSQQCTVVGTFTDTTTQDITPYVQWSTSDPAIVIVTPGGLALASGTGTATITASMNGVSGSTTLTVY